MNTHFINIEPRKYSSNKTHKMRYRFGFNGKENDNEVKGTGNQLDFGARIYDPRLGRWLSLDPLASKYPYASPYNFALNTPIQAIDPDGKIVVFVNGYKGGGALMTDLGDRFGLSRTFSRLFTSEKIYRSDVYNYWGGMDKMFMNRIGDKNAVYADASSHALSTASYRYNRGVDAGEVMLKQITAGEIKLQVDENG